MAGGPSLTIDVERVGQVAVVRMSGELALINYEDLDRALGNGDVASSRAVVIEASHLSFLDSSGLASLVRAHRTSSQSGRPVLFAGFQGAPRRVLQVTRMDLVFSMHDSEQEALAAVSKQIKKR